MSKINPTKLLQSIFIPSVFSWLPCLIRPEILRYPNVWVFFTATSIMIYTQPPASFTPGASDMKSTHDRYSALFIMLTTYPLVAIALYKLIYSQELHSILTPVGFTLGLIFSSIGVGLRIWAIRTLGALFSVRLELSPKHRLVTSGPFSWVRHPSYTGAILILCSPGLLFGQYSLFVIMLLLMGSAYYFRTQLEERMLLQAFPSDYSDYKRRVARLIPFLI